MSANELAVYVVAGLGLLGGIGLGVKAILERNTLKARATHDDASATAIVTAAARELIDPLRKELAAERDEHAREVQMEREKVAAVRDELEAALAEAKELRGELVMARVEADALRREREVDRATIRALREARRED